MSGDVFGNGMLLSRQIRLIAAFDHRHIFIDPDPDPETSYQERERLFAAAALQLGRLRPGEALAGGMIVPRGSKEVDAHARGARRWATRHGPSGSTARRSSAPCSKAPVELLWNGGIGTYVKDAEETHAEVGDPATTRCASTPTSCAARWSARAATWASPSGPHPLRPARRAAQHRRARQLGRRGHVGPRGEPQDPAQPRWSPRGAGPSRTRNALLEEMTDEVNELVLRNNVGQSLAVSLDERAAGRAGDFAALITAFERDRLLERGSEGLPSSETIRERARSGLGLTRPTLCVLLAYAKLHAKSQLLASSLPDDPATRAYLRLLPAPGRGGRGDRAAARSTACAARSSPPSWSTTWWT
jgi:glutamate dehydrogenase